MISVADEGVVVGVAQILVLRLHAICAGAPDENIRVVS